MAVDDITSVFKRSQKKLNVKRQFQCYEDMQRALETDPDAFFCSNYNWYYTGGNLQFQNVGELSLLFHVLNRKLGEFFNYIFLFLIDYFSYEIQMFVCKFD